tara:strand:+ start:27438 stop:27797 length:360 start_codon:yes stop_codon:yes gene_type:complete
MKPMRYEELLRKAFGFASDGKYGDRSCDPADLAEAGLFTDGNLNNVKIGAGYAFVILSTAVINEKDSSIEDGEHDRLDQFLERAISCSNVSELSDIIAEYEDTVISKYFVMSNGIITFK